MRKGYITLSEAANHYRVSPGFLWQVMQTHRPFFPSRQVMASESGESEIGVRVSELDAFFAGKAVSCS